MLTVRPLTAGDDFTRVACVYVESWRHTYRGLISQHYLDKLRPESWIAVMKADPASTMIALEGERIVGAAYIAYARDEERTGYGEIVSLYLLPDATGKGYGRQLMEAALTHCRQSGMSAVCLWVLSGNHPARGFYERMGFRASGRTRTEAIGGDLLPLTEYILPLE
ncbi:MAG: GNAT family N-acetyltransferase [Clostridiales bacterium]|nr:GNAT family N-acetyltransferase [Clostridiales bacterium]